MFYAAIMVCSLQAGAVPPCVVLEDTQGPYETKKLCEERVGEIVARAVDAGDRVSLFHAPITCSPAAQDIEVLQSQADGIEPRVATGTRF